LSWNDPSFERPKGLKIVDMCIYVDTNFSKFVQRPTQTEEDKLTKYIYWIIDSIAKKQHLFGNNYQYYDEFALFLTCEVFCIMRKKLEHAGELSRGKEVVPIKSVLNFVKAVLYPYKVQFEQSMYSCVIMPDMISNPDELTENLRDEVRQQYLKDLQEELIVFMEELPNKIWDQFTKICPYRRDPAMMKRIYISVVLTLIENVTLRTKVEEKANSRLYRNDVKKLIGMYSKNNTNVILWHLPDHMEDYIRFLTYKVKRIISNVISDRRSRFDLSDESIDDVIKTGFTTYSQDQEELQ